MSLPINSTCAGTLAASYTPTPQDLFDNPITYEIIVIIALVSLIMVPLAIARCLQPYLAPDAHPGDDGWCLRYCDCGYDCDCCDEDDDQPGDEEEGGKAGQRDFTLTADGHLLDNDRRGGRYGTFYVDEGRWYDGNGVEMSYGEWVEAVYDPLD